MKDFKHYDLAFEEFLEGEPYDAAAEALYDVVSKAFEAGWLAAGGQPIPRHDSEGDFEFLRRLLQKNR